MTSLLTLLWRPSLLARKPSVVDISTEDVRVLRLTCRIGNALLSNTTHESKFLLLFLLWTLVDHNVGPNIVGDGANWGNGNRPPCIPLKLSCLADAIVLMAVPERVCLLVARLVATCTSGWSSWWSPLGNSVRSSVSRTVPAPSLSLLAVWREPTSYTSPATRTKTQQWLSCL